MANKRLNALITIGGAIAGSLKTAVGSTTSQLGKIGTEVNKLKRNQADLGRAIQTFGGMGKNVDNLRTKYSAVTDEIKKLTKAQERLSQIESARIRNQEKLDKAKGDIGATVATAFAVGATIKSAVSASADFNYNMQLIGNTANMSKQEIQALKDQIFDTSKLLGQTIEEVQRSEGLLIAAGLDPKTAGKMLKPIGMTAIAAGAAIEDVSKASFTLIDVLNTKPEGLKNELGILIQAGKEGRFEFKAMAEYLPTLGASFKSLKMEGSEAAATMGAALQVALKGAGDESEAANNMRNFMAKILAPDTLKKAKKFGVDLYANITAAQKNGGNPFETAMRDVMKMTKGGDPKLLGEIFGDMQVQNFVKPMIQNWEEYERIKKSALSAGGSVVDSDFEKMSDQTKSGIDGTVAAFGRLKTTLGDTFEPIVKKLANTITPVIDRFTEFVQNNPKLITSIGAVVASLTALKVGALLVKLAIFSINSPILKLIGRFSGASSVVSKFAGSGAKIKTAFGIIGNVIKQVGLALLRTPWGAVAAIAIGAGLAIYKYWDYIKAFFEGFWKGLKAGIEPFTTAVTNLVESTPLLGAAWDIVSNAVSTAFNWFKDLLTPINASKEDIEKATSAGETFGVIVGGAINLVLTPLNAVINGFSWIINNASKVGSVWGSVKSWWKGDKVPATQSLPPTVARPAQVPPTIARAPSQRVAPQQNFTNSFTINAAPGQNPNEIANLVMQKINRANGVAQRGSMLDAGYAQ